jgi:hypothetical protein
LTFAFYSAYTFLRSIAPQDSRRGCPHATDAEAGARVVISIEAIMNPQKSNFGFFFQNIFQPSTTLLRVVSASRWTKTLLKITGTI